MESPTSLLAAAALRTSPPPRVPRPRRPRRLGLALASVVAFLAAAPAADAETRSLRLISDGPFRTDPAQRADFVAESADGSRVFFQTDEPLEGTDTDATLDTYMRTTGGALVHITDNPFAPDGPYDAYLDVITPDGKRAFFETSERLAITDVDGAGFDAYERTATGALVHHSDGGSTDKDGATAYFAAVTADGKHAYLVSEERLAPTDTDDTTDIYERGPNGPIQLSDGGAADGEFNIEFNHGSDDGKRLYFTTGEKLAATDTDSASDVYLHTSAGALVHVSDDPTGPDADVYADFLDETPDGSRVWFETRESLAAGDTDTANDIYERAPSGALTLVSDDATEPDANADAIYRGRSSDSRRIVLETTEPLAPTDTDTAYDVYERQPDGELTHVSDTPGKPDANVSAAYNGMSADGARVLFVTEEKLAASDTDADDDVYERLSNGALVHVSDNPRGHDDTSDAYGLLLSNDGTRVIFTTRERLAQTDTDTAYDSYERGPQGLRHLTDDPTGPDANLDAYPEYVSPDGRRVYFTTPESLSRADTDAVDDVYVSTVVPTPVAPAPADRLAPIVTRFKVARSGRVRFALSEPADVRLVVRRRGAQPRTRVLTARPAGRNLARVRMHARGRYRVTITATDAAGNRSAPQRASLRIKRSR